MAALSRFAFGIALVIALVTLADRASRAQNSGLARDSAANAVFESLFETPEEIALAPEQMSALAGSLRARKVSIFATDRSKADQLELAKYVGRTYFAPGTMSKQGIKLYNYSNKRTTVRLMEKVLVEKGLEATKAKQLAPGLLTLCERTATKRFAVFVVGGSACLMAVQALRPEWPIAQVAAWSIGGGLAVVLLFLLLQKIGIFR